MAALHNPSSLSNCHFSCFSHAFFSSNSFFVSNVFANINSFDCTMASILSRKLDASCSLLIFSLVFLSPSGLFKFHGPSSSSSSSMFVSEPLFGGDSLSINFHLSHPFSNSQQCSSLKKLPSEASM